MRALFALGSFTFVVLVGLALWLYARADAFVLRLHGASRLHFEEAPRLHALGVHLSLAAGVSCPRLYWVPGTRPDAYSLGIRRCHSSIVLTRAAFEALDEAQLRALLAHELAHIAHRHTLRATVVAALVGLWVRATSALGALLGAALHLRVGTLVRAVEGHLHRLGTLPERDFIADRGAARLLGDPSWLAAVLEGLKAHAGREALTAGAQAGAHFLAPGKRADIDERITALRGLAAQEWARRDGGIWLRAHRRPSRFFPRSDASARRSLAWVGSESRSRRPGRRVFGAQGTWDTRRSRGTHPTRVHTVAEEEGAVEARWPSARRPSFAPPFSYPLTL